MDFAFRATFGRPPSQADLRCQLVKWGIRAIPLHWSKSGDAQWRDGDSQITGIGGEYLDIAAEAFDPRIEFTFFWKDTNAWEGRNYQVEAY